MGRSPALLQLALSDTSSQRLDPGHTWVSQDTKVQHSPVSSACAGRYAHARSLDRARTLCAGIRITKQQPTELIAQLVARLFSPHVCPAPPKGPTPPNVSYVVTGLQGPPVLTV